VRMHAGVEWMLWGLLWCQAKQPIEAAQELSKPHRGFPGVAPFVPESAPRRPGQRLEARGAVGMTSLGSTYFWCLSSPAMGPDFFCRIAPLASWPSIPALSLKSSNLVSLPFWLSLRSVPAIPPILNCCIYISSLGTYGGILRLKPLSGLVDTVPHHPTAASRVTRALTPWSQAPPTRTLRL
jgi:hypothetical protein